MFADVLASLALQSCLSALQRQLCSASQQLPGIPHYMVAGIPVSQERGRVVGA